MSRKKQNYFLIIIVLFALFLIVPVLISNIVPRNTNTTIIQTENDVQVLDYDLDFANNTYSIRLNSGYVKTNVPIDKIFVNVKDYGVDDISFTSQVVNAGDESYILNSCNYAANLLNCCFDGDATLTVDVYVQLNGRCYKFDTRMINVKSCWTPYY